MRPARGPWLPMGLALVLLLAAAPAGAQVMGEPANVYPDPDKFARGLFVEAEAGAVLFLGDAGQSLGPGAALGVRLGYDLLRWAAVALHGTASSHATDFAQQPQSGQLLQLSQGTAELRLAVPLGRWSVFGVGAGGIGRFSTNLLGTTGLLPPDARLTTLYGGQLGVDYHTASRHFSFGLAAGFTRLTRVATTGLLGSVLYLRYTL
jgi:hypothetical protein